MKLSTATSRTCLSKYNTDTKLSNEIVGDIHDSLFELELTKAESKYLRQTKKRNRWIVDVAVTFVAGLTADATKRRNQSVGYEMHGDNLALLGLACWCGARNDR